MTDTTPEPEQPFDPDVPERFRVLGDWWRTLPEDEKDEAYSVLNFMLRGTWHDITIRDLLQLAARDAFAEKTRLELAEKCADWRGQYEETRAKLEAIAALEVHGREFVAAAELYRILDKPIPAPIDHAANIRARASHTEGH